MRRDLPPNMPARIAELPVQNGYPVPWFVAEVNGVYDFRVVDGRKFALAIKNRRCWICGQKLGTYLAFAIGPMCAINRTTSEPPAHRECAEWAIKACPFLTQRQEFYRETNLPEGIQEPSGYGIKRQPGVVCLWIAKSYHPFEPPTGGMLFEIGLPTTVEWYREGRSATHEEVLKAIANGYPILEEFAIEEGKDAVERLERRRSKLDQYLPQQE